MPVPDVALREAVLNAIIHRDYSVGTPIQIRVYADRLNVWSPGELPERWSVAKLLGEHPSRPFNPCLANAFFRAGEIEAWGRGIQRILDACREASLPDPRIRYEPGDLLIEFAFSPVYLAAMATPKAGPETGEKTGEKTREKVLRLIRADPQVSTAALATLLGITRKGVEWQIRKLKKDGRLRRIGPDKGGQWEAMP